MTDSRLNEITERIIDRSRDSRQDYLKRMRAAREERPDRQQLSCSNLAHGFAAFEENEKSALAGVERPNIAIVSAYNDMLSAHQPLATFPELIKKSAWTSGGIAQFAGGVPAMCDGVTQGQDGMELSLFSRDVIAMATAVALSHNMFDAVIGLGVCDKIVPGMVMGALPFGHLPLVMAPGGPMPSGLPNAEKARIRQEFAAGKVGRDALLTAESKSYHSPGTCTFYGTANSNQLLMEFMGLHLPGASFVNPGTPLRNALTARAATRAVELGRSGPTLAEVLDEKALVNGVVGLLASGGSTNHTMHLVAIARAAGIQVTWDDFSDLSAIVPLLARVYPNGLADVNHFHAAGGIPVLIRELLSVGLLHEDVTTIAGGGLSAYLQEPWLDGAILKLRPGAAESLDPEILASVDKPFSSTGGIRLVDGNLGRAIVKTSAVKPEHRTVRAPAAVFSSQDAVLDAFKEGKLERDVVVVVQYQGPASNGMPELHKLTPSLAVLQDRGFAVALVTDGRMSGASGKVTAAIQVCPEAKSDGALSRVQDGDMVVVDPENGVLRVEVEDGELAARKPAPAPNSDFGTGRELFASFRNQVTDAEQGAISLGLH
ncbi:MAG: phosphogluconate dehydratase [Xanthomonadales bacterium]|nr:phosphogluconate dehydratase [Xanthomonadales bacterium]